jgi:hypothetical protein
MPVPAVVEEPGMGKGPGSETLLKFYVYRTFNLIRMASRRCDPGRVRTKWGNSLVDDAPVNQLSGRVAQY